MLLPWRVQPGLGTPSGQLESFLEQRVADELASEGILLSRLGVTLSFEAVGSRYIVSLEDLGTKRVVASTKIDALPDDREAALAFSVPVVANMVAQKHAEDHKCGDR